MSAIVAAALRNGTVLRYVAELPEDKRKILYVDTEQSPYHCLKVMKRILRMAGSTCASSSEATCAPSSAPVTLAENTARTSSQLMESFPSLEVVSIRSWGVRTEGQFLSQNPFRRIAQAIFGASVYLLIRESRRTERTVCRTRSYARGFIRPAEISENHASQTGLFL